MIKLKVIEDKPLKVKIDPIYMEPGTGGTSDYNELENLPTLNGKVIMGAMVEEDPTVPAWAKGPSPAATIKAQDINAVSNDDAITISYLASLFND